MAGRFDYQQAEEIRDAFARHDIRYLFIGKSGAILLGFPDTTQDADAFVEKTEANGRAIVAGLREIGFDLADMESAEIERGKAFVGVATSYRGRGIPGVPPRRHHREQGSDRPDPK